MTTIAIIPARGGSKGIPRKNLRLLGGKPLIANTIESALRARSVSRVIVSTDDTEIASVSEEYGAKVVWRPADISGDTASSESAVLHVLDCLKTDEGYEPDVVVFLQCTSPLMLPEDIDGTVEALLRENADSALAVTPFHGFLWRPDDEDGALGINHDRRTRQRRQEREHQYHETGAVYVMRTRGFKEAKHRFFGKTAMYVMPEDRCWEIDEPVDLDIAEVLLRARQQEQRLQMLPDPVTALVLDFDGVFTDNRVFTFQDGREAVACNRSDGLGLSLIKQAGIPALVLSAERNPVVAARCQKLSIECMQGVTDKQAKLSQWLQHEGLELAGAIYLGNDTNDIPCMKFVGCGVAVADAHPDALRSARLVLTKPGGYGAIRELCDLVLTKMRRQPDA